MSHFFVILAFTFSKSFISDSSFCFLSKSISVMDWTCCIFSLDTFGLLNSFWKFWFPSSMQSSATNNSLLISFLIIHLSNQSFHWESELISYCFLSNVQHVLNFTLLSNHSSTFVMPISLRIVVVYVLKHLPSTLAMWFFIIFRAMIVSSLVKFPRMSSRCFLIEKCSLKHCFHDWYWTHIHPN